MTTKILKSLRNASEAAWEMAVDTCHDSQGVVDAARQEECRNAMERAMDAWDRAISAATRQDLPEAREALDEARKLARAWGDDQQEREAILHVETVCLIRATMIDDPTGTLYTIARQATIDGEGTPERVREIWAEATTEAAAEAEAAEGGAS